MKNVFVIGLDAFNRHELASIREADTCRFHGLLDYTAVAKPSSGRIEFDHLRRVAETQLATFAGSIDGIVAFWDFPSSALAGVLRNAYGLPGPSNEAICRCEHKYWSRLEQREVVPELVPLFCPVNPFAEDPKEQLRIAYPFWLKPVKAHSSRLGFKIRNEAELGAHLPEIRDRIGFFAEPFDEYLQHVELPAVVRPVTGAWCIAERIISAGQQCTLEGYVYGGEVVVYGVVDSIRGGRHRSSFTRYQYPSRLPVRVQRRMIEAAGKVMRRFAYDGAPFNMEFFWDRRSDGLWLLEINARISKSHCPLFRLVDGASHQEVMVDLALGVRPDFPHRQGAAKVAAKFMHRAFEDGVVRVMPSEQEIARVRERYPEARVRLLAAPGDRLRDSVHRDSYSFELADVFLGARDQPELLRKYDECLQLLSFEVEPIETVATL